MFASNEDEDWVYLQPVPPTNTVLDGAVNQLDRRSSSSSSSSSSSTSSSSSSSSSAKSNRSGSISSVSSTELEEETNPDLLLQLSPSSNVLNQDGPSVETATTDRLLFDEPSENNTDVQPVEEPIKITKDVSILTLEEKESLSSDVEIIAEDTQESAEKMPLLTQDHDDLLNATFEISRRTTPETRKTSLSDHVLLHSPPVFPGHHPIPSSPRYRAQHDPLISYAFMIILFILPFILGHLVARWDQPMIKKMAEELDRVNQRLDQLTEHHKRSLEGAIKQQWAEKLQSIIRERSIDHDHEVHAVSLQVRELQQVLSLTQQNLTNTIQQLTLENRRLNDQLQSFERRFSSSAEQNEAKPSSEDANCAEAPKSPLKKLVKNLFRQTASIAEDTSIHLSDIFERWSASVSDIVDHRHEYVEKGQEKLNHLTESSAAEKVQATLRRGMEDLSTSFHEASLRSVQWLKSRAEHWAQKRKEDKEFRQHETHRRYPWRTSFQRGHDRDQASNGESACQSKIFFPVKQICSLRKWMVKTFRP